MIETIGGEGVVAGGTKVILSKLNPFSEEEVPPLPPCFGWWNSSLVIFRGFLCILDTLHRNGRRNV